jgi:3-phenylpropionate/cinnamic acid dioxygenase small subunit
VTWHANPDPAARIGLRGLGGTRSAASDAAIERMIWEGETTMTAEQKLQVLWDRAEIMELMHRYATAVDSRDWVNLRSVFTDEIGAEMTGLDADLGIPTHTTADRWIDVISRGLARYSVTQHSMSNHRIELAGNMAVCTTYVVARHFIRDSTNGQSIYSVGGYYRNDIVRTADGWKIRNWKLVGTWETTT